MNSSIRKRLVLSYSVIFAVLVVSIGLNGFIQFRASNTFSRIKERAIPALETLDKFESINSELRLLIINYTLVEGIGKLDDENRIRGIIEVEIPNLVSRIDQTKTENNLSQSRAFLFDNILAQSTKILEHSKTILFILKTKEDYNNPEKLLNVKTILENDFLPLSSTLHWTLQNAQSDYDNENNNLQINLSQILSLITNISFALGILGIILSLFIAYKTTNAIVNPINKLINATRQVVIGNYEAHVDLTGKDEVTQLGSDFNIMTQSIKRGFENEQKNQRDLEAQQKELEKEIDVRIQIEKKLRVIDQAIRQSPIMVEVTDLNGKVDFVNESFEKITGYSQDEVKGKKLSFLKSGKTPENQFSELWQALKNKKSWTGVLINKKKSGEHFYASKVISPVVGPDGQVSHYIGIGEDISEKIENEKKLKHLMDELKNKNEELEQFAYSTSHDLRSPLKTIQGLSVALQEELDEGNYGMIKEFSNSILHSAQKLDQLILNIFEYTKAREGQYEYSTIDFKDIWAELIKNGALPATDKVKISTSWSHKHGFISQKVRIYQILSNLVSNAIKYSNPEEPNPIVRVKTDSMDNNNIKLIVEDNGIGIPEHLRHKIFTMFFRASSENISGTGLGLSLVKKHVERLNGKLEYIPLERGTQFVAILPSKN